jgi:hypothetical protein
MTLRKKDAQLLKLYQKYRQKTPTFFALRPRLRWLLGVVAVAAPFSLLTTWWLTREIVDWKRVDALVSEYERAAIQPDASPTGGPAKLPLGSGGQRGPLSVR